MPRVTELAVTVPALDTLAPATQKWLGARTETRTYTAGAILALEGDPPAGVWVVIEGTLRLRLMSPEGREQVVAYLSPGDWAGLVPVLDNEAHPATVDAVTPVSALWMPREVFGELLRRAPGVSRAINRQLAARVRGLTRMVEDLALRPVNARLARFLLSNAEQRPSVHRWTQYDIAAHIGTVRDVVGRAFRELAREGIVRRERGRLVIADRAALERMAQST